LIKIKNIHKKTRNYAGFFMPCKAIPEGSLLAIECVMSALVQSGCGFRRCVWYNGTMFQFFPVAIVFLCVLKHLPVCFDRGL
jgi:hypothetical protein